MESEKKKRTEKKPDNRRMKSPEELASAYVESVEHSTRKLCGWYKALTKKLSSKKYDLLPEQRAYVIEKVVERHEKFVAAMSGAAKDDDEVTIPK